MAGFGGGVSDIPLCVGATLVVCCFRGCIWSLPPSQLSVVESATSKLHRCFSKANCFPQYQSFCQPVLVLLQLYAVLVVVVAP
jgi:hypothetical protein